MSELRPPPAFAQLISLQTSARLLFWVLAIDLLTSLLLVIALSGVEAVPVEQSFLAPVPSWAWVLSGLCNLLVLAACLRFAWPLLGKGAPPPDLLESSLRRMATMWRAIGAVTLVGLTVGLGFVIWIITRLP